MSRHGVTLPFPTLRVWAFVGVALIACSDTDESLLRPEASAATCPVCDPLTTAERQQVQFVINSIDTEFHPRCAEVADELQHMLDNNDILAARGGLPDDAWGAYYSNDDEIGIDASGDDPDFDWDYLNYGFQVTVLHEGFHAGGILNHIQADIYAIECQGVFL